MPEVYPTTLPAPLVGLRLQVAPLSIRTEMETGRVRQRRMALTSRTQYNAQWNFTYDQFDTFKVFFDETLVNGSLSFSLDLGDGTVELAFMSPYTFTRGDNLFAVSGVLEEIPTDVPETAWLTEEGDSIVTEDGDYIITE